MVASDLPGGRAGSHGLVVKTHRDNLDYRMGWYVIIGNIPICVLGLWFKDEIRTGVRNLWVVAIALVAFSAVIAAGLFSLPDAFKPVRAGISATGPQLAVHVLIAFVVGLAAIAWLLRFLARHSMYWFVVYRLVVGALVMVLLGTRVVAAT